MNFFLVFFFKGYYFDLGIAKHNCRIIVSEVNKLKVESAKLDVVTTRNIPPTMHMAKEKYGAADYRQK